MFKEMTREDVLSFLNGYRKSESIDLLHRWIGTYNMCRVLLVQFFRWLYYPDLQALDRSKPSVIENIPQLKSIKVDFIEKGIGQPIALIHVASSDFRDGNFRLINLRKVA
jgi:hypothetical protein